MVFVFGQAWQWSYLLHWRCMPCRASTPLASRLMRPALLRPAADPKLEPRVRDDDLQ